MLEQFHFTSSKGEDITVPYMNDALSYRQARAIRKKFMKNGEVTDPEAMQDAFMEASFDADMLDKIEGLSMRDFMRFVESWAGNEDASMGESSAS